MDLSTAKSPYTATDVAAWFLRKTNHAAGETISHTKLQILLYFAEAWSLAVRDRALFDEELMACGHGPVAPSVWDKLSIHGWNNLGPDVLASDAQFDDETSELLTDVFNTYAALENTVLEGLPLRDKPWKEARRGESQYSLARHPIDKAAMAAFYKASLESETSTILATKNLADGPGGSNSGKLYSCA